MSPGLEPIPCRRCPFLRGKPGFIPSFPTEQQENAVTHKTRQVLTKSERFKNWWVLGRDSKIAQRNRHASYLTQAATSPGDQCWMARRLLFWLVGTWYPFFLVA